MRKTIVLLDVDGVLIHARGYRAGIQSTVNHVIRQMGQPHIKAPQEADVLAFEAQSIIFEWDSIAICVAALLMQVPQVWKQSFDIALKTIAESGVRLQPIDYADVARRCPPAPAGGRPARAALGTLFPEEPLFVELLGNTHEISAPMTRIFQNFVLGDAEFEKTYRLKPLFESASLLETLDRNMLTPQSCQRLQNTHNLFPTVYTARPSLPPSFVQEKVGYPPEAEIAGRQLALDGVPLVGYGRMQWLAEQQGVPANSYVKPSPVQALTAIFSALLRGTPDWERRAFHLALAQEPIPDHLKDAPWRVIVFEDSTGGIRGVREAVALLAQQHEVSVTAVGIAKEAENIAALRKVADHIADDVNAGLAWALGW